MKKTLILPLLLFNLCFSQIVLNPDNTTFILSGQTVLWSISMEENEEYTCLSSKDGKPCNGLWRQYDPYPWLYLFGGYINGKKDGLWTQYHEGSKKVYKTIDFKDGLIHGTRITYYKNGNVEMFTEYKDGKNHGLHTSYDESGNMTWKSYWKNGFNDGESTSFYQNGKIQETMNYKNGFRHGVKTYYDHNGKLLRKEIYKNGKIVE